MHTEHGQKEEEKTGKNRRVGIGGTNCSNDTGLYV
jgi:hypothetical protein